MFASHLSTSHALPPTLPGGRATFKGRTLGPSRGRAAVAWHDLSSTATDAACKWECRRLLNGNCLALRIGQHVRMYVWPQPSMSQCGPFLSLKVAVLVGVHEILPPGTWAVSSGTLHYRVTVRLQRSAGGMDAPRPLCRRFFSCIV